jgi:hypothetical protein
MDTCKCGRSFIDLEEGYCRAGGCPSTLKDINYNFFDELLLCMKEQGYPRKIVSQFISELAFYYDYYDDGFIRKLEDKMIKELIDDKIRKQSI